MKPHLKQIFRSSSLLFPPPAAAAFLAAATGWLCTRGAASALPCARRQLARCRGQAARWQSAEQYLVAPVRSFQSSRGFGWGARGRTMIGGRERRCGFPPSRSFGWGKPVPRHGRVGGGGMWGPCSDAPGDFAAGAAQQLLGGAGAGADRAARRVRILRPHPHPTAAAAAEVGHRPRQRRRVAGLPGEPLRERLRPPAAPAPSSNRPAQRRRRRRRRTRRRRRRRRRPGCRGSSRCPVRRL